MTELNTAALVYLVVRVQFVIGLVRRRMATGPGLDGRGSGNHTFFDRVCGHFAMVIALRMQDIGHTIWVRSRFSLTIRSDVS